MRTHSVSSFPNEQCKTLTFLCVPTYPLCSIITPSEHREKGKTEPVVAHRKHKIFSSKLLGCDEGNPVAEIVGKKQLFKYECR